MAAYISFQPTDYFNTKLYTGTGASNAQTGVGFQPDFTWLKSRSAATAHYAFDSVRGATKAWFPNLTDVEATNAEYLKSWESDGFTVGTNTGVNDNTKTYASWNWKAGTTTGIAGSPSTTPTGYSFNATAGQSIIQYTGTGVAGATLPHGLGVAPEFIIVKNLTAAARDTHCYHVSLGNTKRIYLNLTSAASTSSTSWNDTTPTSTLFTVGANEGVNENTKSLVAYCFASKKGFSKMGIYTGNGNADGTFVYTGFRPAYILVKRNDAAYNWGLQDTARDTYNPADETLNADDAASVQTGSGQYIDYLSNGFKMRNSSSWWNGSGAEFIYAAFAEFPIVSSNSKAGTAR